MIWFTLEWDIGHRGFLGAAHITAVLAHIFTVAGGVDVVDVFPVFVSQQFAALVADDFSVHTEPPSLMIRPT